MSNAANNTALSEKVLVLVLPESSKSFSTVFEKVKKRYRNLEKRKCKLERYKEEFAKDSRALTAQQTEAISCYDQVVAFYELVEHCVMTFKQIEETGALSYNVVQHIGNKFKELEEYKIKLEGFREESTKGSAWQWQMAPQHIETVSRYNEFVADYNLIQECVVAFNSLQNMPNKTKKVPISFPKVSESWNWKRDRADVQQPF